ncbi:ribosome biogenesis gtpase [Moniliophthora roreri MCA 2997]|uniref:Ribosome biogenesis gtpase n=1 Tax=Moniliophthora roreri (strain MCA 2997) TaxID=1381753 RepID=V2XW61_MONRO|nr:ribosome biogenesis gtpase [Moniliophthora roreri MCA 2997]
MAPKGRNPNPSGLGRAIINKKAKDARQWQESGMYTTDLDSTSKLKSVTQERDLDEFLNTAQLAEMDFTAERRNVKVISQSTTSPHNPYLLTEQEEKKALQKHAENRSRLRVPRRPGWAKQMTTAELERQEKASFLDWRRSLAVLQEEEQFLLTPFERNIEVWRQLWRVIERSHLVVQIVDARNPLRFRCEDLEDYVCDVEGPEGEKGSGKKGIRKSLLLINKADLLTSKQRLQWAKFLGEQGVEYAFFSAANAAALQQARRDALATEEEEEEGEEEGEEEEEEMAEGNTVQDRDHTEEDEEVDEDVELDAESDDSDAFYSADEEGNESDEAAQDSRTRVLSVLELEELFIRIAPDLSAFTDAVGKPPQKTIVGLVGYPNVGKSSTINALLGEKKVSVSSTPGKTKHFQTIHLSGSTILCDCPGLVFPQFATTKAELVCDGVLPIDQMKEYTGPVSLVAKRIPREVLEATYGLSIHVKSVEGGGDGKTVTAEGLSVAYAIARGYMRSGQGTPDEARAARYILKDYVNAKLLFCHPPPGVDPAVFNEQTHRLSLRRYANKKHAPTTRVGKGSDTYIPPAQDEGKSILPAKGQDAKSRALDREFFDNRGMFGVYAKGVHGAKGQFARAQVLPHQNTVTNDGVAIAPKYGRLAAILAAQGIDGGKKHKKPKRVKQRSGKGYD